MAAALMLRRDGHVVTVFERFDAPRALGSGLMLQPTGMVVLDTLELGEAVRAAASRIERLFGRAAGSGAVVLDVRYTALGAKAGCGFAIHRAALFEVLHRAVAAAGIPVVTGRTLLSSTQTAAGRSVSFADGTQADGFDLVVDSLGHGSPLAPPTGRPLAYGALWASLDWPGSAFDGAALEQRYRAASIMAGVLPIGLAPGSPRPKAALFWSLRTDQLEAWRMRGLQAWKADFERIWPQTRPLLEQIVEPEQLTFARYAHRTLKRPFGPALAHIGDAWHSTSPQLGQGANMALLDAYALALALREAPEDLPSALARYARLRTGHVRLYQTMSALFTPVYQSDGRVLPFLRDRLVGPLSKAWPVNQLQAGMVSGLIGAPLRPLGLAPTRQARAAPVPAATTSL
jgi:salicylate hydroxylase